MAVTDLDKIDGIAVRPEDGTLMLLITDHLDWLNEYEHLSQLQNKLPRSKTTGYWKDGQFDTIGSIWSGFNTHLLIRKRSKLRGIEPVCVIKLTPILPLLKVNNTREFIRENHSSVSA
jgi:hypothetical protein